MTEVQIQCELKRPLDAHLMERAAAVHGVYGFFRVQANSSRGGLTVGYDASHMSAPMVGATLLRAGIPLKRCVAG